MKDIQKDLYFDHIEYFLIIHRLGRGIILKPQLVQYMSKLNGVSISTVNRTLKKLEEVKLIRIIKTKTVSIIGLTTPSLALVMDKDNKKVSVTNIYTNNNLTHSSRKNEYIINHFLSSSTDLNDLLEVLNNTNLVSNAGDNSHILDDLLKREQEFKGSMKSSIEIIRNELSYVKTSYENKKAQLKNSKAESKEIINKDITINNLQARHLYFKELGKVQEESQGTYAAPLEIVYIEMNDLLNHKKVKRDLSILNEWANTTLTVANRINIYVVVESNRVEAVSDVLKEWKRKTNFDTPIYFKVVPIDVNQKYYKGLTVVL